MANDRACFEDFEIFLSVLGYEEDGEWVALALEMDLRGYGPTFEEAFSDLRDLVMMQISFALFKGQPGLIEYPADIVWWERFAAECPGRANSAN